MSKLRIEDLYCSDCWPDKWTVLWAAKTIRQFICSFSWWGEDERPTTETVAFLLLLGIFNSWQNMIKYWQQHADAELSTVPLGGRERRAATAVTSDHDMYPHWVLLCCGDSEWRVFLWFLHSATCPASCDHPSEPVNSDVWTLCVWCYSKKEAVFNLTNKTVKI